MKWLGKARSEKKFGAEWQRRLEAWRALPPEPLPEDFSRARYVVADVESSGLNVERDRLISIGAVAIEGGGILPGGFDVILRQDNASSTENILVHRIGGTAQQEGSAPQEALLQFLEFAGKAPLVAYHAAFDSTMIARALRDVMQVALPNPWLDLAWVLPDLCGEDYQKGKGLDDWLARYGIRNIERHDALSDAFATAQLMLVTMALAKKKNLNCIEPLLELEAAQQWLSRSQS